MIRIGAIILARLDSRRLPGKALRDLRGRPLLQHAVDICRAVEGLDGVVLATTQRTEDDALADFAAAQNLLCFRGALEDVAGRFVGAMERFGFDAALRFNGDSPLHRPALLAEGVACFRQGDYDLVTNVPGRRFPFGISVEVVGRPAMRAACAAMIAQDEREHVTQYFYRNPALIRTLPMSDLGPGLSGLQLAVDDADDLARAGFILDRLGERRLSAPLTEVADWARVYDCAVLNKEG